MIELWTWATSNGHKLHIMLEELGIEYRVHRVDIHAGQQFEPEFLKISPNNKIPAIVDSNGPGGQPLSLFESGAILIYLADKFGRFIPRDGADRYTCIQWLMFQMASFGPMTGQYNHFHHTAAVQIDYAKERYANEVTRLYRVVEKRLSASEYFAGDYSIADIAMFPWMRNPDRRGINIDEFPGIRRWMATINERPAVQRAFEVVGDHPAQVSMTDAERDVMFGKTQYQAR
jgi:GSH-dependent disulfide-bond oxidoreductase